MSQDEIGYAIYLVAMLVFVGSYVLVAGRGRVPTMLKQAVSWALVFLVVIAGFGLWEQWKAREPDPEIAAAAALPKLIQLQNGNAVEIQRGFDGHYHVTVLMNNTPVAFVIDTGATDIVLSQEDARRIGIDVDHLQFSGRAQSANGEVATATARIATVSMGPFTDRNVRVSVNGGEMAGSLLGMAYLNLFDKVAIEGRKLVISRN